MKEFVKKIFLFAIYAFLVAIVLPLMIDPFNIFHAGKLRDNGIEPNKNYIKMRYILDNPDKFDCLLFGSSRVGAIHVENIDGEKCYNMTYSMGVPSEHLENIKTLVDNEIIPRKIYIGLDSLSYMEDGKKHYMEQLRCPYEYSVSHPKDFYSLYLNPYVALKSLMITFKHKPSETAGNIFYEYGWWCDYGVRSQMDWADVQPAMGHDYLLYETLDDIREIVDICKDNEIELVVFTNPMHELTYGASVESDYLLFLEELAQITPYYNFSGINEITVNKDNYLDAGHYNAYVGDEILECICRGTVKDGLYEDGFGVYVNSENIEELLSKLAEIR